MAEQAEGSYEPIEVINSSSMLNSEDNRIKVKQCIAGKLIQWAMHWRYMLSLS